jgi:hypothetical protein
MSPSNAETEADFATDGVDDIGAKSAMTARALAAPIILSGDPPRTRLFISFLHPCSDGLSAGNPQNARMADGFRKGKR